MKKPYLWALILGIILVASDTYSVAQLLTNPTSLPLVNVAIVVTNVLWIIFGAFLITIYLRRKQHEEVSGDVVLDSFAIPSAPEALNRRRDLIIASLLTLQFIGSASVWILNDYTAGLTLNNLTIIFDVIFGIVFGYLIVELFWGRRDVSKLLLYNATFYALEVAVLSALRGHWYTSVVNIFFAVYIIFSIKSFPTKRNFRIAHLVVLPAFFALMLTSPLFDNGRLPELSKKEFSLEQQYANDNNTLSGAYVLFLQRERPTMQDIRYVQDGVKIKRDRIKAIELNLDELTSEYKKQLNNIPQQKALAKLDFQKRVLSLYSEQLDKLGEFMSYAASINLTSPTDMQIQKLIGYKNEIDAYLNKVTEVQTEMENANLN